MATRFVVRDTNHPQEDLARNWSAPAGGFFNDELAGTAFDTLEEGQAYWEEHLADLRMPAMRFHPAHEGFVEVHYQGLGAWELEADNLEDALAEAADFREGLAWTDEAGDGRFYAEDVVSFHQVSEGRYIFELSE